MSSWLPALASGPSFAPSTRPARRPRRRFRGGNRSRRRRRLSRPRGRAGPGSACRVDRVVAGASPTWVLCAQTIPGPSWNSSSRSRVSLVCRSRTFPDVPRRGPSRGSRIRRSRRRGRSGPPRTTRAGSGAASHDGDDPLDPRTNGLSPRAASGAPRARRTRSRDSRAVGPTVGPAGGNTPRFRGKLRQTGRRPRRKRLRRGRRSPS